MTAEEIKSANPLLEVAQGYGLQFTKRAGEHYACCPFHEDKEPSFRINPAKGFWRCDPCNKGGDVITFVALKENISNGEAMRKLSGTNGNGHAKPEIVAEYSYTDETGAELFQVVRMVPKTFRQRHKVNREWVWKMEGVRKVPYHLPEVLASKFPVIVVEGERDVDNLRKLGFVATCNPGGAGKWTDDYSEALRGKQVVLVPDNDEPGRAHMAAIGKGLEGKAAAVLLAAIPEPDKDATDFIKRHGENAKKEVAALFGDAKPFTVEQMEPQKRKLTVRRPSEIVLMTFDKTDRILGDYLLGKGQPTTWLGAGGIGKSRLILQAAASTIRGIDFLGLETNGADLRWLIVQTENSNRRLQSDFLTLRRWAGSDWGKVDEQIRIHTLENDDDGFVSLNQPDNQAAIADLIEEHKPGVIVFDPLGEFGFGNLDKDEDMRATCQTIARLARKGNPERSINVLHHARTGKAGAASATGYERSSFGRNSKALLAWTRAQINISPGSADSNESLVISCGKCSNGKEFTRFAVRLNEEMIYELDPYFDFDSWETEVTGTKPKAKRITPELVAGLCDGGATKGQLAKRIMDECGCAKTKAYDSVEDATKAKKIKRSPINGTYLPA